MLGSVKLYTLPDPSTPSQPGSSTLKLEGSLDTFPLPELIDMAVYSSVTGAINIYTHGEPGRLYFRDGILYHVSRGASKGVDALAELFEYNGGTFAIVGDAASDEESLWGALSHHLQTAERLASRWRMVRPYVPNLELVPSLLTTREAAIRRIGPAHQPVLNAIDGQTNLRQLAESLGWAVIDVAEAVVQMSVDGLVDLRTTRGATVPTATTPETPATRGGIFDRLRAPQPPCQPSEGALYNDGRASEDLILRLLRS